MRFRSNSVIACLAAIVLVGPLTTNNNAWSKENGQPEGSTYMNPAELAREQQKRYEEQMRAGWRRQHEFDREWYVQHAKQLREEAKRLPDPVRVRGLAAGHRPGARQTYYDLNRGRTVRINGSMGLSTFGPIGFTSQVVVGSPGPLP